MFPGRHPSAAKPEGTPIYAAPTELGGRAARVAINMPLITELEALRGRRGVPKLLPAGDVGCDLAVAAVAAGGDEPLRPRRFLQPHQRAQSRLAAAVLFDSGGGAVGGITIERAPRE